MPDFDVARRRALMGDLLRLVRGEPVDLLSFDTVREDLGLRHLVDRGVVEVPLEQIVGTIDRDRDFNRVFLPRGESLRKRWQAVKALTESSKGFPPVELYKVGEVYFVVDGHHRVSVLRSMGAPTIEARVHEFLTQVVLEPSDTIEEVMCKGARADFLEATELVSANDDDYVTSSPRGYARLLEHIQVHRYFLGLDERRDISWHEAVASWRETVYAPMIRTIRESGILEEIPGHTVTDFYLYVMDHLHYLREEYGDVEPERAVREVRDGRGGWWEKARRWWRR
jgi:hypothetical protein